MYSHSNDLVEHTAANILAEKARKRTTASDLTFRERAAATADMKIKTKIENMGLKTRKKKRKWTSDSEIGRHLACSIAARHSQVIGRLGGESRQGSKR